MNPAPARPDVYAPAHQALRLSMADCLARLGRMDVADEAERRRALGQLDALLDACRRQAAVARAVLHPAIEARCPGATLQADAAHRDHRFEIEALRAEADAFAQAPDAAAAARLSRHVALFVGRKLVQMDQEDAAHNAALWASYDDRELDRLRDALRASTDILTGGLPPTPPTPSPAEGA